MSASTMRQLLLIAALIHFINGQQYQPSYVMSSSWSMWSPWSFCSHGVMIRVRACSTVRGFKCIGHNKEFQSCDSRASNPKNLDYSSEENDRELAMHQLYDDYDNNAAIPKKTPQELMKKSPMRTRKPIIYSTSSMMTETPTTPTTTTTTTTTTTEAPKTTTKSFVEPEEMPDMSVMTSNLKFNMKPSNDQRGEVFAEEELLTPSEESVVEPTTTTTTTTTTAAPEEPEEIEEPETTTVKTRRYYKASYVTKPPASFNPFREKFQNQNVQAARARSWASPPTTASPVQEPVRSEFAYNSGEFELGAPSRKSYPIASDVDVFEDSNVRKISHGESDSDDENSKVFANQGTSSLNSWSVNGIEESIDEPVEIVEVVRPTTTSTTSTTTTTEASTTSEYVPEYEMTSIKPHRKMKFKGRKSRLERLRRLNERARIRTLAVIATPRNPQFNSGEVQSKDASVGFEKTTPVPDTASPSENLDDLQDDMLSGDTARALSWLLANMTALVDEGGESPIVDSIPLEKVISQPASFSISNGESEFTKMEAPADGTEATESDEEVWSDWSGWSSCNCGSAYRKRTCISRGNGCPELPEYHKKACKSDVCNLSS